jgi:plasmid stabilization system protein ParE
MKLKFTKGFREKLNAQVDYIARDKPAAARRFKNDLIAKIKEVPDMPLKHRKSIFFDREDVRDLVFKGYITAYRVKLDLKEIEVFGFTNYQEDPFK